MTFLTIYNNTTRFSFFELSILVVFDFVFLGILYRPILIGKFGNYFFNYNYEDNKILNFLTNKSKHLERTKNNKKEDQE